MGDGAKPTETTPDLAVTVLDHTKLKLAAGFEIRDVTTGFESRWVVVEQIPSTVGPVTLFDTLSKYGQLLNVVCFHKHDLLSVKARYESPSAAINATTALNGSQVFGRKLIARVPVNNTRKGSGVWDDTCVRLAWRPACKDAFAGYSTLKQAEKAVAAAQGALVRQHTITASHYDGIPSLASYTVRFRGLPPTATAKDLGRFGHAEAIMMKDPNYRSTGDAIARIREILDRIGEVLNFDVLLPNQAGKRIQAWAHFTSPAHAKQACDVLHDRCQRFTGKDRIHAFHIKSVSYALPINVYRLLSSDITALRQSYWQSCCRISVIFRQESAIIKLSGDNTKVIGRMKTGFERLLRGEIAKNDGKPIWHTFFESPAGEKYIHELEPLHPDVQVQLNNTRHTIALLGPKEKRDVVRLALIERLEHLKAEKVHVIHLTGNLLEIFMNAELLKLQRDAGTDNVVLDLANRTLRIRGSDELREKVCKAVCSAQRRKASGGSQVSCPVCLNKPMSPIALRCGHSWCRSCLSGYICASIDVKAFPLTCLGNHGTCPERIPLSVAQDVLTAPQFDAVVLACFLAYVYSHPREFHFCPTPDCPQVYRRVPRDAVLHCPACLTQICAKCHGEYHEGEECVDDDDLFQQWATTHGVKSCPGCQAAIERAEGCNHVTCIQCRTHICWVCMQTFANGNGIYDHMRNAHGGIYPSEA